MTYKILDSYAQAITTKYLGPTNHRGGRIKATCYGGSVTIPCDHALDGDANHAAAAAKLVTKMGWNGDWIGGKSPNCDVYYYVRKS